MFRAKDQALPRLKSQPNKVRRTARRHPRRFPGIDLPLQNPPTILPFRGISPDIAGDAFIAPNVSIIGDVRIGAGSSIWYGCTVRGDVNKVRIGKGSNLQDNSVIHVDSRTFPTVVGDDVLIGHQCLIHGCTIGDGVTIGMQSCLMDGVVVEPYAMVAAGSLVTPGKVIPSGQIWAGRPAKFMQEMDMATVEARVEGTRYYARLAQEHKAMIEAVHAAAASVERSAEPDEIQGPMVGGRPWEGP